MLRIKNKSWQSDRSRETFVSPWNIYACTKRTGDVASRKPTYAVHRRSPEIISSLGHSPSTVPLALLSAAKYISDYVEIGPSRPFLSAPVLDMLYYFHAIVVHRKRFSRDMYTCTKSRLTSRNMLLFSTLSSKAICSTSYFLHWSTSRQRLWSHDRTAL